MALKQIPKEAEQAQIICVIGGPCVGKGTHCKQLANDLAITHLSVGDLLRAEANKPETENTEIIIGSMKAGGLVPNEIVQDILDDYLVQNVRQGRTYFLVDGFPRSLEQAVAFKGRGWKVKRVLHLHGSEKVMRERMFGRAGIENRIDDTVETHKKRLEDFMAQSPPVISFFQQEGIYSKLDCDRDFPEVYCELPDLVKSVFGSVDNSASAVQEEIE